MTAFSDYFFSCPNCHAVMAGKKHNPDAIKSSILFSDGKMMCDALLVEDEHIINCPSCAHVFWLNENKSFENEKDVIVSLKDSSNSLTEVYPFNSWYQFGCNTTKAEGKKALIDHYLKLLVYLKPYTQEQELYLRKSLLWAINDLIRYGFRNRFRDILSGNCSLNSWRHERPDILLQRLTFKKLAPEYKTNIQRLTELIKNSKDYDKLVVAELYREKGEFEKSIELIQQINRSTYFVSLILEKAKKRNSLVFQVAG
ncbi:MAG: hypothetical protein Q8T08_07080 [Ignavibacteria bacterium]|nr:hypothetical protein [Ignavibacteria bacterium]